MATSSTPPTAADLGLPGVMRRLVNPVLVGEVSYLVPTGPASTGLFASLTGTNHRKWARRELRFDGHLLVCLEDKLYPAAQLGLTLDCPTDVAPHVPASLSAGVHAAATAAAAHSESFPHAATLPGRHGMALSRAHLLVTPQISSALLATPESWLEYWASVRAGSEREDPLIVPDCAPTGAAALTAAAGPAFAVVPGVRASYHVEDVDDDTPPPQPVSCSAKSYQMPQWSVPSSCIANITAPLPDHQTALRRARNPLVFVITTVYGQSYAVKTKTEADFTAWTFALHFAAQQSRHLAAAAIAAMGPTPAPVRMAAGRHPQPAAAAARTTTQQQQQQPPHVNNSGAGAGNGAGPRLGSDTRHPLQISATAPDSAIHDSDLTDGTLHHLQAAPKSGQPSSAATMPSSSSSSQQLARTSALRRPDVGARRKENVVDSVTSDCDVACLPRTHHAHAHPPPVAAASTQINANAAPAAPAAAPSTDTAATTTTTAGGGGSAGQNLSAKMVRAMSRMTPGAGTSDSVNAKAARAAAKGQQPVAPALLPKQQPRLYHWAAVHPSSGPNGIKPSPIVPPNLFFSIFIDQLPTQSIAIRRKRRTPDTIRIPPPPKSVQGKVIQIVPAHLRSVETRSAHASVQMASRPTSTEDHQDLKRVSVDTAATTAMASEAVPRFVAPVAHVVPVPPRRSSSILSMESPAAAAAAVPSPVRQVRRRPTSLAQSLDLGDQIEYPQRDQSLRGAASPAPPPMQQQQYGVAAAPPVPMLRPLPSMTLGAMGLSTLNRRGSLYVPNGRALPPAPRLGRIGPMDVAPPPGMHAAPVSMSSMNSRQSVVGTSNPRLPVFWLGGPLLPPQQQQQQQQQYGYVSGYPAPDGGGGGGAPPPLPSLTMAMPMPLPNALPPHQQAAGLRPSLRRRQGGAAAEAAAASAAAEPTGGRRPGHDSLHEFIKEQDEERGPADVSIYRMWQALGLA
ncbi:hypothetical protein BC828DRAFT_402289 [Blastocladiella britannica]|nr:hypothetical protein BC828DRAFT_402289 [Blastocladiella britannica]